MTTPDDSLSELIVQAIRNAITMVPESVRKCAGLHFVDALGVGAAGSVIGPLSGLGARMPGSAGPCSVVGLAEGRPAAQAALINGMYIHSLEYDDTHVPSVMHGSATLVPAALAVAEANRSRGDEALAAYAVAWELMIRMGLASPGSLQARGFQTTSTAGPFAAAMCASLLYGLDDITTTNALGIAGSQAGGTFAFLEGGDSVKAAQPGLAAQAGVISAELAAAGVSGPARVLDGEFGFFKLYADDPGAPARLADLLSDLGSRWHLLEAAFKLVPCCHFIHPYVEAVDRLMREGAGAVDIAAINFDVPTGAVPVIAADWPRRQNPGKANDARWSLPYVIAGQLLDGHVGPELFQGDIRSDCVELAGRMTYDEWGDSDFPRRFPARIRVTWTDGRTSTHEVSDVLGGAGRPVPVELVMQKAEANFTAAGVPGTLTGGVIDDLSNGRMDLDRIAEIVRAAKTKL